MVYNPLGVEKLTYQVAEEKQAVCWLFTKIYLQPSRKNRSFVNISKTIHTGFLISENRREFWRKRDRKSVFPGARSGGWTCERQFPGRLLERPLDLQSGSCGRLSGSIPGKEKELLYERVYTTFLSRVNINPRYSRYEETEKWH